MQYSSGLNASRPFTNEPILERVTREHVKTHFAEEEAHVITGDLTVLGTTTFSGPTGSINSDDITQGTTNLFMEQGAAQTYTGNKTLSGTTTFTGATSGINLDDVTQGSSNRFFTAGTSFIPGFVRFTEPSDSSTTSSGALVLTGGLGCQKTIHTLNLDVTNTTASTSTTTGAIKCSGGVGVDGAVVAKALQVQEVVSAADLDSLPGRQIVAMDSASLNALKPGADRFVVIDGPLNGSLAMNIRANSTDDRFIIVTNQSYLPSANPDIKLFEVGLNEGVVIPIQLKHTGLLLVGTESITGTTYTLSSCTCRYLVCDNTSPLVITMDSITGNTVITIKYNGTAGVTLDNTTNGITIDGDGSDLVMSNKMSLTLLQRTATDYIIV